MSHPSRPFTFRQPEETNACSVLLLFCKNSDWTGECRPGMYAIEVVGELPQEVLEFLEEKRIPFHCKPPESTK